jgi:glycosyltransferase involved in cell wall biosynthesis
MAPLVSVIVPVHNGAATIDETLQSIRSQTYGNIEIIVVDDGSTDATASIVAQHASQDSRINIIYQPNAGVASARNHGLRLARGEYVAPIDADDLWAATKIEKQMEAMHSEPGVTLVFTWFACIDRHNKILSFGRRNAVGGQAFQEMCERNLVGNGSGALMRKDAVLAAGGYDETLHGRRAQGCEDYKLYIQLTLQGKIVAVPEFLTGYRISADNMSSNYLTMYRSHELVARDLSAVRPDLRRSLVRGRIICTRWYLFRALRTRRFGAALALFGRLFRDDAVAAIVLAAAIPILGARALLRSALYRVMPRRDREPLKFVIGTVGDGCASKSPSFVD